MKRTALLGAVAIAIGAVAASCGDQPTAPRSNPALVSVPSDASAGSPSAGSAHKPAKHKGRAALLTNVPVSGVLGDGGTFAGTFTAQKLTYDETAKTLVMSGVLTGKATTIDGVVHDVTQQFATPVSLSRHASASSPFRTTAMATCDILFLDLAPLHLDLLGLTLDLGEVVLDLNAVSGAGNLLGNLLCAVTGLLDGFGILASIGQILDAINNILAGLTPPGTAGASWVMPAAVGGVALVHRS
ncbi:MAG TPA: hypothetical protein VF761_04715 [Gemmatimonadaceae bacterium]